MNLITIGRSERVKLLDLDTEVYAKIDTGAYYSSIDVSLVEELDGVLRYRLFREGKEGYTGDIIETTEFKMLQTRSSNGHEQIRHMIQLNVELGGKRISEWFSLANREKMFYPILVGRNIIKEGFVVDVTKGRTAEWDTSEF